MGHQIQVKNQEGGRKVQLRTKEQRKQEEFSSQNERQSLDGWDPIQSFWKCFKNLDFGHIGSRHLCYARLCNTRSKSHCPFITRSLDCPEHPNIGVVKSLTLRSPSSLLSLLKK